MVKTKRSRRGEGLSEYTILLTIVMVCSVVGLISAGSRAMRQIASDKNLCRIEGKECDGVGDIISEETTEESSEEGTEEGTEEEANEASEETTEEEAQPENDPEGLGDSADDAHPNETGGDSVADSGSSSSESTVSAWDQFWGPWASNPMVQGFAGLMSWWI